MLTFTKLLDKWFQKLNLKIKYHKTTYFLWSENLFLKSINHKIVNEVWTNCTFLCHIQIHDVRLMYAFNITIFFINKFLIALNKLITSNEDTLLQFSWFLCTKVFVDCSVTFTRKNLEVTNKKCTFSLQNHWSITNHTVLSQIFLLFSFLMFFIFPLGLNIGNSLWNKCTQSSR